MKQRVKQIGIWLSAYALLFCLSSGCASENDAPEQEDVSADSVLTNETEPAVEENTDFKPAEQEDVAKEEYGPAESAALQAAEQYRALYENAFSKAGGEVTLSYEQMREVLACLSNLGYAAVDEAGSLPMENAALLSPFLDAMNQGAAAALTVYQVYTDAGFLCHTFHTENGTCTVTRTRLAWLEEGPFRLPGTVPTITYSDTYAVMDITYNGSQVYTEAEPAPTNPPAQ